MPDCIKVLIVVKTYPLPSMSYYDLVCTAGVKEDGSFVRLYPIDYRYQPYYNWYRKYQWLQVEVEKNTKDPRPESFRPRMETAKLIGQPLSTRDNWAERRRYVLAQGVRTMCELQGQNGMSLGIIRPRRVLDFRVEQTERQWKPKWQALFAQQQLFGPDRKPLEKIPFKFSYLYECEEAGCKGHKMMVEDWELGQLYRDMRDKFESEKVAVSKVRDKFLGQICAPEIDTHFFVGTVLEHATWIVLGVFWPKK